MIGLVKYEIQQKDSGSNFLMANFTQIGPLFQPVLTWKLYTKKNPDFLKQPNPEDYEIHYEYKI